MLLNIMNKEWLKIFLITLIVSLIQEVNAQIPVIENSTFYFPHPLQSGKALHLVGLAAAKLPEDVVETDDIIRAPLFSYELKFGLPENFIAYGGIHTNIVSNHFAVGTVWNYNFERFGIEVGTDLAYWFGRLTQFGFNTSYKGLVLYPNIGIGYRFNKFTLSLKSELVLDLTETSKNGNLEVTNNGEFLNGFTVGIYLEQPLWKDNYVVLGIRSTYLKFYYPVWAAFSTFDRTFYIPEFIFKFIL